MALGDTNLWDIWGSQATPGIFDTSIDVAEGGGYVPPAPANTTYYPSGGNNSSGGSIWNALASAFGSAAGVLGTRYAVPQLNPGQTIQSGPYGTILTQNAVPTTGFNVNAGLGGSLMPLLLIGGIILLVSKH